MEVNLFRARRDALGKTQQEIADAMGVTSAAVSAWERDVAPPSVQLITRLAKLYGVSVSRLVAEADRIEASKPNRETVTA